MSQDAKTALKQRLLAALAAGETVSSFDFVNKDVTAHLDLVGVMKSLLATQCVAADVIDLVSFELTAEGEGFRQSGSIEAQYFAAIPAEGSTREAMAAQLGPAIAGLGIGICMRNKWISQSKEGVITKLVPEIVDQTKLDLEAVYNKTADSKLIDALKKRKLVVQSAFKVYTITKGPQFTTEDRELLRDLDTEALRNGKWSSVPFKDYNFEAEGEAAPMGAVHPLGKVRAEMRKILTGMGFQEMPTNTFVESSFWNFDSLFQPQQHPARDAHDTFFLDVPATADQVRRLTTVYCSMLLLRLLLITNILKHNNLCPHFVALFPFCFFSGDCR